jgi:hypothetical protein
MLQPSSEVQFYPLLGGLCGPSKLIAYDVAAVGRYVEVVMFLRLASS